MIQGSELHQFAVASILEALKALPAVHLCDEPTVTRSLVKASAPMSPKKSPAKKPAAAAKAQPAAPAAAAKARCRAQARPVLSQQDAAAADAPLRLLALGALGPHGARGQARRGAARADVLFELVDGAARWTSVAKVQAGATPRRLHCMGRRPLLRRDGVGDHLRGGLHGPRPPRDGWIRRPSGARTCARQLA